MKIDEKYKRNVRDILLPGLYGICRDLDVDIKVTDEGLLVGAWKNGKFRGFKITNKDLQDQEWKSKFGPQCKELRDTVK